MRYFCLMFRREWIFAYRQRAEILNPWIFLFIITTLFPLALSPEPALLQTIAPGIIWVGILLSTFLNLEKLFRREVDDGVIEQWLLTPNSFLHLMTAKLFANWCIHYLPLMFFVPIIAFWLALSMHALHILLICLLLATPTLHFVGAIFSALTVRIRNNGLLLGILVLPFYIPVLIFAASAVANAQLNLPIAGQLAFLGALLVLTVPLAPIAVSAALKIGAV
jgi:heme exporter protein B